MLTRPKIICAGVENTAQPEESLRWWHATITSIKRGLIRTQPALGCEIKVYIADIHTNCLIGSVSGYSGRWVIEDECYRTIGTKTIYCGKQEKIPLIWFSAQDTQKSEGTAKAYKGYITEARWYVSDNPACELSEGQYTILVKIYSGAKIYLEHILSVTIPGYNLEDCEMKSEKECKKEKRPYITKKQFHDLLNKAAQPVKKQPPEKE